MMVLVDTPVWSLALRRNPADSSSREKLLTQALRELIGDGSAQIMGPIRQELLSGIRRDDKFRRIRDYLRAFDEPLLEFFDYEDAASMNNHCRSRGISGSGFDFLICAVAHRRGWEILTTDTDFTHYQKAIPVRLFAIS